MPRLGNRGTTRGPHAVRRLGNRRGLIAILVVLFGACVGIAHGFAAEGQRRYEDGPLTTADFRGDVPADAPGDAFTRTQLQFDFRYRYQQLPGGRATVTVTEVTVDAYVLQDQSWNRKPGNVTLLEHEQGHADNAWIQCLKARLFFDQKRRRGWKVSASSLDEATDRLRDELTVKMKVFEEEGLEADVRYDRDTKHGLGPLQAELRRVQVATIQELEAEWQQRTVDGRRRP
jgi:hypothetical protein